MLKVGDRVPDFTLPLASKEGRGRASLSDALAKGDLVLVFYPMAFTGVCTKQVCETRDRLRDLEDVGAQVYGFSVDPCPVNVAYAQHHDLNFPLFSDANHEVVERIWDVQTVAGVHRRAKRGVMVVARDGTVKYVRQYDDPGHWDGLDDVRAALRR